MRLYSFGNHVEQTCSMGDEYKNGMRSLLRAISLLIRYNLANYLSYYTKEKEYRERLESSKFRHSRSTDEISSAGQARFESPHITLSHCFTPVAAQVHATAARLRLRSQASCARPPLGKTSLGKKHDDLWAFGRTAPGTTALAYTYGC